MQSYQFKMPIGYQEDELLQEIKMKTGSNSPIFIIQNKSLEARKQREICWNFKVLQFKNPKEKQEFRAQAELQIPSCKKGKKATVIGSGPAGFFSALVLQSAGIQTTIFERGEDVESRSRSISKFETSSQFNEQSNYCFGEGGAGTFSDGKLTSRSKRINLERNFIMQKYVEAGAPEEILYMKHPHLGSDNLKLIVKNLRQQFISAGGEIRFKTKVTGVEISKNHVSGILTEEGLVESDYTLFATGHSAYDTYRMLIQSKVQFRPKRFAIGSRIEHPRELINLAQWGRKDLPGVKAAEYRLTYSEGNLPVYTFCMCPGGTIVPSGAVTESNVVNGMSLFARDEHFSNAACVAAIDSDLIEDLEPNPLEILNWVERLEKKFYQYAENGYQAPGMRIKDFISGKESSQCSESSYPFGILPAALGNLLPKEVTQSLQSGLAYFSSRIKGFDSGQIIGLESKTSAPIQVLRDKDLSCEGFNNLFLIGECSGYSGGIISSAADGVKAALSIIEKETF